MHISNKSTNLKGPLLLDVIANNESTMKYMLEK